MWCEGLCSENMRTMGCKVQRVLCASEESYCIGSYRENTFDIELDDTRTQTNESHGEWRVLTHKLESRAYI